MNQRTPSTSSNGSNPRSGFNSYNPSQNSLNPTHENPPNLHHAPYIQANPQRPQNNDRNPQANSQASQSRSPKEATQRVLLVARVEGQNSLSPQNSANSGNIEQNFLERPPVFREIIQIDEKVVRNTNNVASRLQRHQEEQKVDMSPERIAQRMHAEMLSVTVDRYAKVMNGFNENLRMINEKAKAAIIQWSRTWRTRIEVRRDQMLEDLEKQHKLLFDEEVFSENITLAQRNIATLNSDCQNLGSEELSSALKRADNIKEILEDKIKWVHNFESPVVAKVSIDSFIANLDKVIQVHERTYKSLQFPGLVDQEESRRVAGGASLLSTRTSGQNASVFGSVNSHLLNFSDHLRKGRGQDHYTSNNVKGKI